MEKIRRNKQPNPPPSQPRIPSPKLPEPVKVVERKPEPIIKPIIKNYDNIMTTSDDDTITMDLGIHQITIDKDLLHKDAINEKKKIVDNVETILDSIRENLNTQVQTRDVKKKQCFRKGLLIGINYTGTSNELRGCINDTENLKNFLIRNGYLTESDMIFMSDSQKDKLYPTKNNILEQLNGIVQFSNEHFDDKVFIFLAYSGHGTKMSDLHGDEKDGEDEMLCPIDCDTVGFIDDDYMKKNFIDKLGSNVTIVVLIDACHSGTMLDLKYNYKCDASDSKIIQDNICETKCNIVMISGCRDNQTSADAYMYDSIDKRTEFQGAMTNSFINCYNDNITTNELLRNMKSWLQKHLHRQVPECSSGKLMITKEKFTLREFKMH